MSGGRESREGGCYGKESHLYLGEGIMGKQREMKQGGGAGCAGRDWENGCRANMNWGRMDVSS